MIKYEVQTGLVEDLVNKNKELKDMTEDRDELRKRVEDLEFIARPAEGETEERKSFRLAPNLFPWS